MKINQASKTNPIGVFDSGIGGLSVLKQLVRFMPSENYIYLGDTARVPYGNKSVETVNQYSMECAEFLINRNVKLIVVACNTASSLALETIQSTAGDLPVIGMINPAANAAIRATNNGKVGIIGTRATISSNAYDYAIKKISNDKVLEIISKACPLFVPLVEEGWVRHQSARIIAEEYLGEVKSAGVDTLILGCTHYPMLSQLISEILPGVTLIDTGEHASVVALRQLAELGLLIDDIGSFNKPSIDFFVTDLPTQFQDIASLFLGFDLAKPIKVNLGGD